MGAVVSPQQLLSVTPSFLHLSPAPLWVPHGPWFLQEILTCSSIGSSAPAVPLLPKWDMYTQYSSGSGILLSDSQILTLLTHSIAWEGWN